MENRDGINTPLVAYIGLVSGILVFATVLAIQVLYLAFEPEGRVSISPAAPPSDAEKLIAEQEARLQQAGYLDRSSNKLAIPIDRAMELVTSERQQEEPETDDPTK